MLKLVVSDTQPSTEQRITRIYSDTRALRHFDAAEIRRYYAVLEHARDELSRLLDRTDGKHV
jgi:hypothetical protein